MATETGIRAYRPATPNNYNVVVDISATQSHRSGAERPNQWPYPSLSFHKNTANDRTACREALYAGEESLDVHTSESVGNIFARYVDLEEQFPEQAIARALISSPATIVADELVSMVDASLRMSIESLQAAPRRVAGVDPSTA
jgi:hypothetical protein